MQVMGSDLWSLIIVFSATLKNFYVQISRAVHGMTLVTDNKEELIQAIQRNTDEKPVSLDVLSSKQLVGHYEQYKQQNPLSLQTVIDKKQLFEAHLLPKNISELYFTPNSGKKLVSQTKRIGQRIRTIK